MEVKKEEIALSNEQLEKLATIVANLIKEQPKEQVRKVEPRNIPKMHFTKPCRFFKLQDPKSCKKGQDCSFLHLDPSSFYGGQNIDFFIFKERHEIILDELKTLFPGSSIRAIETRNKLVKDGIVPKKFYVEIKKEEDINEDNVAKEMIKIKREKS